MSATVLVQRVGRSELVPAQGALLELQGSGQRAVADVDGNVRLTGLETTSGVLALKFDVDGDGVDDGSRLFDLQLIGGGFGHDVSLGVVVLGRLASVTGLARRADRVGPSGHSGIHVFVAGSPAATITADDGSFVLPGLPEGAVPLTFFAAGYAPTSNRVTLGAGENQRLAEVLLAPSIDSRLATLEGDVRQADSTPVEAVEVRVEPTGGATTTSGADGTWRLGGLAQGVANLSFIKAGFAITRVQNLLLLPGGVEHVSAILVPGDADAGFAGEDAGPRLTQGPVRVVSAVGSSSPGSDGGIQLNVPALASAGDLVAVVLHRSDPRVAVQAAARGWRQEAEGLVPGSLDDVLLLWRVVEADEQARRDRYWFEGPNGADWVIVVLRGGLMLASLRSGDVVLPARVGSASAGPGDLLLTSVTTTNPEICEELDGGATLSQFGSIRLAADPVGASGRSLEFSLDCPTQFAARLDQVRVLAAPP